MQYYIVYLIRLIHMKHPPKQLLPFFWHFAKPYRWYFLGMMITALVAGLVTSLSPYLSEINH